MNQLLPAVLISLILGTIGLVSCNSEKIEDLNGGEATLALTSSIDQTRVTTQTDNSNHWDGNEQIGVYAATLNATNVLYTATTAGQSTAFNTETPIKVAMGNATHNVIAYFPYDAAANNQLTFDLTKNNSQPLLYATSSVTHGNPKLNLNFGHKLGKLRIKVDAANALNPAGIVSKISLSAVKSQAVLEVSSGNMTVGAETAALDLNKQGEEYYTYLMPGEAIKNMVVQVIQDGKVYKATLTSDKNVEAGKYYLYTIKLGNGEASVDQGNGTIDGDTEGDTGDIEGTPEAGATEATITGSQYTDGVLTAANTAATYSLTVSGIEAGNELFATIPTEIDWITITGATLRAAEDRTLTVTVAENSTKEAREATIQLEAEGINPIAFTVKQDAGNNSDPETPVVEEGDGTLERPYTVAQAIANQGETGVYVKAYIRGAVGNGAKLIESSTTNMMLAESMEEVDASKMLPVELPKGAIRDELNLSSHPENRGRLIIVKGNLVSYFGKPGLKGTSEYKFL